MTNYINIIRKLIGKNKTLLIILCIVLVCFYLNKWYVNKYRENFNNPKTKLFPVDGITKSGTDKKVFIDGIPMTPNHQIINPSLVKGFRLGPSTKRIKGPSNNYLLTLRQCQDECVRENCKFLNRPSQYDDMSYTDCIISKGHNQMKLEPDAKYRTWENAKYVPPIPKSYVAILSQKQSGIFGDWYNLVFGGGGANNVDTFYNDLLNKYNASDTNNEIFDVKACSILDLQDLVNSNITECFYGWVQRNGTWVSAYPDGSSDTNCGNKGLNTVVICSDDDFDGKCSKSNLYIKFKSYKTTVKEIKDILKKDYNVTIVATRDLDSNPWISNVTSVTGVKCKNFHCKTNYVQNGEQDTCPFNINHPLGRCTNDFCCKKAQQCSSYTCPSNMVKISDDKYCDKNPDGLCKLNDCCQLPDETSCSDINCEQEYKDYIARGGGVSEFDWKGTYGEQLICERDVGKGGYINNKWNWGCCKATRNDWSRNTCDSRDVSSFCSYGEGNCRP